MTQSKTAAKLLTALAAALVALVLLAPASPAAEPKPGYTQFTGCPSPEENPNIFACFRSDISGGHFQMGSKDVPITKPITLIGGYSEDSTEFDYNSKGGLLPVKQEVPGGVIGITGLDWLVNFLSLEGLKLYAVTELAGDPGEISFFDFTLPIKVHLINPVLGNNCYVGSDSNPIQLTLTTGTTSPPPPNEPIKGTFPNITATEDEILHIDDGVFVDNSFSAPGASGCKLTLFGFLPISLNGLVNAQAGLPAAAGTNETVQEFDAELSLSETVFP